MENKRYHTAGRASLTAYLMRQTKEKPQSADEIYRGLAASGKTSGRSSVYRQLNELSDAGEVRRFRADPGSEGFIYQYVGNGQTCDRHFHLQCLACGKVEHLHCACAETLCAHLIAEHGCAACAGKETHREDRA